MLLAGPAQAAALLCLLAAQPEARPAPQVAAAKTLLEPLTLKGASKAAPAKSKAPANPAASPKPTLPAPPLPVKPAAPVGKVTPAIATEPARGADLKACASCHGVLYSGRKAHKPVKDGDCAACHVPAPAGSRGKCRSPVNTAWTLRADQPALCNKCHDTSGVTPPHPVIKSSGCTACHDPHASVNPSLAKIWPVEALCAKCHARFDDAQFIHTAVKQGKCLGCHNPHAGEAAPLLVDKREALCAPCHKLEALAKQHTRHAPAIENRCLDCHDPHRSDAKAQTVEAGKKLCLTCHDAKKPPRSNAPSPRFRIDLTLARVHKPVAGDDCQACHTQQHGSETSRLLQKPLPELCFKCHTRFEELYKFQHGAAKVGGCAVCHDPHSSANQGLLRAAAAKDLCFRCHQDDLKGRKWVHKPVVEKGCTACHDAHGSDAAFSLEGEIRDVCLKCHKPVDAKKNVHRALTRYGCTECHNPHASSNDKGLLKPINQLCLGCHADKNDPRHVTSVARGGHKLEGGPDPHDVKKDFSCASCHDPHASDGPKLLRYGATPMESCAYCHGDKTGKHPELKDVSHVKRPAPAASAAPASPPASGPDASQAASPASAPPARAAIPTASARPPEGK